MPVACPSASSCTGYFLDGSSPSPRAAVPSLAVELVVGGVHPGRAWLHGVGIRAAGLPQAWPRRRRKTPKLEKVLQNAKRVGKVHAAVVVADTRLEGRASGHEGC